MGKQLQYLQYRPWNDGELQHLQYRPWNDGELQYLQYRPWNDSELVPCKTDCESNNRH
jgi:hypothetical protein